MPRLELITRNSDGRKNFYDEKGRIYFENWLLQAVESSNHLIRIQRSEDLLWNFLTKDGSLLSHEWFEMLDDFVDGYAFVKLKGKGCNYIDETGHFLCRLFFDEITKFNENGFAVVKKDDKYNVVTMSGNLVFKEWFKEIDSEFGVPWRVRRFNNSWNAVDSCLKFVSRKWYDDITPFVNGFAKVKRNTKTVYWSYIGEDGKRICDTWFESVDYFYGEAKMARVQRKGDLHYNYIKRDGTFVGDAWYVNAAISAHNGWALIQCDGDFKYNYINENGELLSKVWFIEAHEFRLRNVALVCNDEKKWNYIMPDGRFALKQWYDRIDDCGVLAYYKNKEDLDSSVIFF